MSAINVDDSRGVKPYSEDFSAHRMEALEAEASWKVGTCPSADLYTLAPARPWPSSEGSFVEYFRVGSRKRHRS